jgi:hypothetical protein
MEIDLPEVYGKLLNHIDHKIVCVGYGDPLMEANPFKVALECKTCNCAIIYSYQPLPPKVEPEEKGEREIPNEDLC